MKTREKKIFAHDFRHTHKHTPSIQLMSFWGVISGDYKLKQLAQLWTEILILVKNKLE